MRKRREWSPADLAARCAELGAADLTENVIENIESRSARASKRPRPVTVDELLALALALDVAPVNLVVPLGEDEPWAITAAVTKRSFGGREWFRGRRPFKGTDRRIFYSEVSEGELRQYEAYAEAIALNPDAARFSHFSPAMDGDIE